AYPNATYFIFVSDTHVPIKPAVEIMGYVAGDPRSRLDLFCYNYWDDVVSPVTPKASQFVFVTREHAELLTTGPALRWDKRSDWMSGLGCGMLSSPDEIHLP